LGVQNLPGLPEVHRSLSTSTAAAERRPIHRLFAFYLLVSAPALFFPHHRPGWQVLVALHVLVAAILLQVGPVRASVHALCAQFPRTTTFIADWYLLLLVPALYSELVALNLAVWDGRYFDALILPWEERLFGGQPSRDWSQRFNILPLSEVLHFAYVSYYLIIYVPPIVLYARGKKEEHRIIVFGLMLTFFVHYLFFVYFPVQGPRYLFPAPTGEIATGPVYALTHKLLEAGSSQGAAFPSSHVGVSVAQTVLTWKYLPRLAPVVTVMTALLALGAIYGGFHYAADALAGLLLGLITILAAPRLREVFAR
jgi:membrane-associated phospholipid phosphatase